MIACEHGEIEGGSIDHRAQTTHAMLNAQHQHDRQQYRGRLLGKRLEVDGATPLRHPVPATLGMFICNRYIISVPGTRHSHIRDPSTEFIKSEDTVVEILPTGATLSLRYSPKY